MSNLLSRCATGRTGDLSRCTTGLISGKEDRTLLHCATAYPATSMPSLLEDGVQRPAWVNILSAARLNSKGQHTSQPRQVRPEFVLELRVS